MLVVGMAYIRLSKRRMAIKPETITYIDSDQLSMELDLYTPEQGAGPHPLIIWIHGGAWKFCDKTEIEPGVLAQVKRGYAIASVSYSLSKDAKWPTQIFQVKAAIRHLRANAEKYNIDPTRIIAWGASSGGHMANMLGVTGKKGELEGDLGYSDQSSAVNAVISWYGASNFLEMNNSGMVDHNKEDSPESLLIGGAIQLFPEKVALANPINFVNCDAPPYLLMHGKNDQLVPANQSEIMHTALNKVGATSELVYFGSYTHADPRFNTKKCLQIVESFLDNYEKQVSKEDTENAA